jgi:hypothetical protein
MGPAPHSRFPFPITRTTSSGFDDAASRGNTKVVWTSPGVLAHPLRGNRSMELRDLSTLEGARHAAAVTRSS